MKYTEAVLCLENWICIPLPALLYREEHPGKAGGKFYRRWLFKLNKREAANHYLLIATARLFLLGS